MIPPNKSNEIKRDTLDITSDIDSILSSTKFGWDLILIIFLQLKGGILLFFKINNSMELWFYNEIVKQRGNVTMNETWL